jgi:Mg2+ and Co2+ transporter CorA
MDLTTKAARVRSFLRDDVFKDLVEKHKQDQIDVFLDPGSTLEEIDEARRQVRAIEGLLGQMRDVLTEAKIHESKTKKRG